jgi:L-fuculose-phosphate aldolase
MSLEDELREELCWAGKILAREGLVLGREGNISARIVGTDRIIIKPSKFAMNELSPGDLIVVDLDGKLVEGDHKPSKETPMHTSIYKHRADVKAVFHTHPIYSTCLGIMGKPIVPLSFAGFRAVVKGIPVVPYHHPGSIELANAIVKTLGEDRLAVLLKYHGLVVVGENVKAALGLSIAVEKAAKVQLLCSLLGKPKPIPRKLIKEFLERLAEEG